MQVNLYATVQNCTIVHYLVITNHRGQSCTVVGMPPHFSPWPVCQDGHFIFCM